MAIINKWKQSLLLSSSCLKIKDLWLQGRVMKPDSPLTERSPMVSSCPAGILGGFTHRAAGGESLPLICALTREEFPDVTTRVVLQRWWVQFAGWDGCAGTGFAVGFGAAGGKRAAWLAPAELPSSMGDALEHEKPGSTRCSAPATWKMP